MNTLFNVKDLSVLVSGSSRGIGLKIARGFLEHGAKVSILSENKDELEEALSKLEADFPGRAFGVVCDVRSMPSCHEAVSKVIAKQGGLTTTICNAGVDRIKPVEDYLESDWEFILGVNLSGAFYMAQSAVKHYLKAQVPGTIIFTSSIAGSIGIKGLVPYAASKGGLNQLTRTMAVELAPQGIRVNAIAPGYVENIMTGVTVHADPKEKERIQTFTPMGRRCRLEELVGPYIFLASPASSHVTGQILHVDGGYTAL